MTSSRDMLIGRRDFGVLAIATLLAGHGMASAQPTIPLVGLLSISKRQSEYFYSHFRRDMRALGWEENRNLRIVRRWAEGGEEGMAQLAHELVAQGASLLFGAGDQATRALQQATSTVTIVAMTDDMVGSRLVESMARPGGNTTGVSILASELDVKRLELLFELTPKAHRIGVLADP